MDEQESNEIDMCSGDIVYNVSLSLQIQAYEIRKSVTIERKEFEERKNKLYKMV